MGQEEVIEVLQRSEKPLAFCDLVTLTEMSERALRKCLQILVKVGEVQTVEIDRTIAIVKYNCRRRMRLYFIHED